MNTSFNYQDICGPEPDLNDYSDLRRWEKWMVWHRKFSRHFPASNGIIREDGTVVYHVPLKSQITRKFREGRRI